MSKLNGNSKKFVMLMGLVVLIGAVAVIGFSMAKGGGFPLTAALLIIVGLMAVFVGSRK